MPIPFVCGYRLGYLCQDLADFAGLLCGLRCSPCLGRRPVFSGIWQPALWRCGQLCSRCAPSVPERGVLAEYHCVVVRHNRRLWRLVSLLGGTSLRCCPQRIAGISLGPPGCSIIPPGLSATDSHSAAVAGGALPLTVPSRIALFTSAGLSGAAPFLE